MSSASTICLITPAHVSSNPRLVKEADTLQSAGMSVHVIAGQNHEPSIRLDRDLMRSRSWRLTPLEQRLTPGNFARRVIHKWINHRQKQHAPKSIKLAAQGYNVLHSRMVAAALGTGAERFIGHTVAGLGAAAEAAQRCRGRFAFDAEDHHATETDDLLKHPWMSNRIRLIERTHLPKAAYVTAASPLIAEAYAQDYQIPTPSVVLNVFPSHLASSEFRISQAPKSAPLRAYWFSQTVGPGRGLEPVISLIQSSGVHCSLHLRGSVRTGYAESLQSLGHDSSNPIPIEFLAPAPPDDMIKLAADYDFGLALEQEYPPNRDICLTNKIFTYLQAGLPILATPTRAQRRVAEQLEGVVTLVDFNSPQAATEFANWSSDRLRLNKLARRAWQLGQDTYNWDSVQSAWLDGVQTKLMPGK